MVACVASSATAWRRGDLPLWYFTDRADLELERKNTLGMFNGTMDGLVLICSKSSIQMMRTKVMAAVSGVGLRLK